ncbi:uncharacterized protein P174DRAFT_214819 [Aspergillus novofumigatus IBT 16806]|uniref:Uncharacterized protein n=1 Tax=Aspergillus novofumigatus (strain IBT 16806) TaxID=1392255 RepID=A0A2I1C5F0_ASPN1|nr:uncharacterized protein P174DRAFT_214819 [Aspergillus novofumigatus IBT 16806]PKX92853.1 hypothetical protein P174DRAFT_214819 [Aspergillus novofumigatus IBT 16806]
MHKCPLISLMRATFILLYITLYAAAPRHCGTDPLTATRRIAPHCPSEYWEGGDGDFYCHMYFIRGSIHHLFFDRSPHHDQDNNVPSFVYPNLESKGFKTTLVQRSSLFRTDSYA